MAGNDQDPLDDEQDPNADNPDDAAEDQAEAANQPGSDLEQRLLLAEQRLAQQASELDLFRRGSQASEPVDDGAGDDGQDDLLARATQDSWALAERIHGEEAVDAYRVAWDLIERATTPADYVTAFEAYHQVRLGKNVDGSEPAKGSGKPDRAAALQPRVDANQSDAGPDLQDADKKLSEARKGKDLGAFVAAATTRLGFGPVPGSRS
ncbi:MAG TPA: hypothetical protein VIU37_10855 [Candidatus Limnocylindrales bacterium]